VFTGLIADVGEVLELRRDQDGMRLRIATALAGQLARGDSIAVNGVCLTATAVAQGAFATEAMRETLQRSALGALRQGSGVNLELAVRVGDRLGGHIVQGHVDATGTVLEVLADGFARRVRIAAPASALRYVVHKGSIAVDGVSLTVASLDERSFEVSLIPETLQRSTLGALRSGDRVNLEVDLLAKYVERLIGR
jgi:riboflavin synthase